MRDTPSAIPSDVPADDPRRSPDRIEAIPQMARLGDVDLDFDYEFERRWWRVEKIFWAFGALMLVLGILGFTGRGPVSETTVRGADGRLTVDFERFCRFSTPDTLRVRVSSSSREGGGPIVVHLNETQINEDRLEVIQPHPVLTRPDGAGGAYFTFALPRGVRSGEILFTQQPSVVGFLRSRVSLPGSAGVRFTQFVWP